jgi:hypothetical protein
VRSADHPGPLQVRTRSGYRPTPSSE